MNSGRRDGFTLLEVALVLLLLTLMGAGLAMPLAAQVSQRRQEETRRQVDEAREAVLGFAIANGRLPCPATAASRGQEAFEPGGSALDGRCASFHDGFLPAAALGVSPLDADGFARDAWGTASSRLRYAVHGGEATGGVDNALTRVRGMQAATLAALGASPGYLLVCASGAGLTASSCGAAPNQLTRRAAFVILSLGPNANATPARGTDESRNVDGDGVFVSREATQGGPHEFDDLIAWVPIHLVVNRLANAGRLP